ncbi:MAG: SusC/RagA family TonB-linked outer membrane protein [Paludibacteraceae bacterium]|nr:SusC/RagA family TonB-linked outer membrane protein [Paludibacteraceae bacterium]
MKRALPFLLCFCLVAGMHAAVSGLSENADTLRVETSRRGHLTNALDVLNGQTAGVTVGSNMNPEAMLSSVRVRGNHSLTGGNEPLVIIDGMSSDLRTLATVFPGDIESFTILKDAAQTAQYGARGASGVIEVRTRRGTAGKFHVSYAGDVGFAHADRFLEMMTADGYRTVIADRGLPVVDRGADTDWQRAVMRTGFVQNHHLALGGGTENANYRGAVSFSQNNSIVREMGTRNLTAKLDVTQHALDRHLTFDLGLFGAIGHNRYLNDVQKMFYSAAAFNPTFPAVRNASGGYDGYTDASQINNPLALLDIKKHNEAMHFNTHLRITGNIGYGLTAAVYGSYSYDADDDSRFYPTYVESTGKIYRGSGKSHVWLANVQLRYVHDWGAAHHLEADVLGEMQGKNSTGFHTTVNRLASNAYGYDNIAVGGLRLWEGTGSFHEQQRLASVMARVSYTALGRYSLTLAARGDASSVASKGHKWGFFPSANFAWNMKKEAWLQDVSALTRLTLKAGWGLSGNLSGIPAYQSLRLLVPTGVTESNGLPEVILGLARNENPNLNWEKTQTANAGMEWGFWNNRVLFTADYYYSYIYDMLYNYTVPVPPFIYDKMLANLGKMENQGLEFGIGVAAVKTQDWDLNIGLNLAWQQNRLLSLNGYYEGEYLTAPTYTPIAAVNGAGLHGGNTDVVYQIPGYSLGVFYLPHCTGLALNGKGERVYQVEDLDGNGVIDLSDGSGDRRVCGQATPKVLLGSNISVRYRWFDLSVQLNGAFGHKIYNGSALSYMNMGSLPYYNVLQAAPETNINDLTVTDYWLEPGDYVNIDYLTFGWNYLPPAHKSPLVTALRLSVSVNNLATVTAYSGLTPVINSTVINNTLGVDDKRTYPVSRTYSFSLQLQF